MELFQCTFNTFITELKAHSTAHEQMLLVLLERQNQSNSNTVMTYFYNMTKDYNSEILNKDPNVFNVLRDKFKVDATSYPVETRNLILDYLKLLYLISKNYRVAV